MAGKWIDGGRCISSRVQAQYALVPSAAVPLRHCMYGLEVTFDSHHRARLRDSSTLPSSSIYASLCPKRPGETMTGCAGQQTEVPGVDLTWLLRGVQPLIYCGREANSNRTEAWPCVTVRHCTAWLSTQGYPTVCSTMLRPSNANRCVPWRQSGSCCVSVLKQLAAASRALQWGLATLSLYLSPPCIFTVLSTPRASCARLSVA